MGDQRGAYALAVEDFDMEKESDSESEEQSDSEEQMPEMIEQGNVLVQRKVAESDGSDTEE